MTRVDIKQADWDTIRNDPDYDALIDAYAQESSIDGMPKPNPNAELYKAMIEHGLMFAFTARIDNRLSGFIGLLVTQNPHYGCLIGTIESFFVMPEHRSTGAGLKLLAAARAFARERGAQGLLISAPTNSTLSLVLKGLDFVHTNQVYFRPLT